MKLSYPYNIVLVWKHYIFFLPSPDEFQRYSSTDVLGTRLILHSSLSSPQTTCSWNFISEGQLLVSSSTATSACCPNQSSAGFQGSGHPAQPKPRRFTQLSQCNIWGSEVNWLHQEASTDRRRYRAQCFTSLIFPPLSVSLQPCTNNHKPSSTNREVD